MFITVTSSARSDCLLRLDARGCDRFQFLEKWNVDEGSTRQSVVDEVVLLFRVFPRPIAWVEFWRNVLPFATLDRLYCCGRPFGISEQCLTVITAVDMRNPARSFVIRCVAVVEELSDRLQPVRRPPVRWLRTVEDPVW